MRIIQVRISDVFEHFCQKFARFPTRHREIVEQIIAAIARSSTGDFTVKLSHETKSPPHQINDIRRLQIAAHHQVIAREASHRTPIDDAIFPFGIIAQISCSEMLNGVDVVMVSLPAAS